MFRAISANVSRTLVLIAAFLALLVCGQALARTVNADAASSNERLLAVHDGSTERGILTKAATLREAFREAGIAIDPSDRVEPALDEKLHASNYEVNIYRARPVTIVDGQKQVKVMSPYRTAKQIAKQAGMTLRDEDLTRMSAGTDLIGRGSGVELTITRATEFTLGLYGKNVTAYTQAKTVADMLKEKEITLGSDDTISARLDAPIERGMKIEIWRNGAQTVTVEQKIPFETETILDMDHPIGYRAVKAKGTPGMRLVSYEVVMKDGKEVSRKKIQTVVSSKPQKQIQVLGNKPVNPLTKSKGAQHFIDSRGVSHRETYYDLPMNVVIGACGGGDYSVREDGAKVDKDGYILVAANYGNYPRCSVVETSMGLGKVYDTGGFALRHPHGFDLATDWTNYNGR